jgi:hypothetical protein
MDLRQVDFDGRIGCIDSGLALASQISCFLKKNLQIGEEPIRIVL